MPTYLAEWEPLYKAMALRGFGQADVDEMELWVVASILDLNRPDGPLTEAERRAEDARMNAARVRAAATGEALEFETQGPIVDDAVADDTLSKLRAIRAARARGEAV